MNHINSRRTPYDDNYETCERTYAELRIYSDDMDPRLITRWLGIDPTEASTKGEPVACGMGRQRVAKGWFLSSENVVASRDLRRHLDWLLDKIELTAGKLGELQNKAGLTMGINCVWWSATGSGGPTLWPEQMVRMANLELECSFEVCFFGEEV